MQNESYLFYNNSVSLSIAQKKFVENAKNTPLFLVKVHKKNSAFKQSPITSGYLLAQTFDSVFGCYFFSENLVRHLGGGAGSLRTSALMRKTGRKGAPFRDHGNISYEFIKPLGVVPVNFLKVLEK